MKPNIHPAYGTAVIRCACGNVIETRSTRESISVDVCSACHPFFTGQQKLLDTAGRIDKFQKRFEGRVTTGKKVKKSRQTISFSPTIQNAPEPPKSARSGGGAPASAERLVGGSASGGKGGKKKPAEQPAQKK
ncbi:MAG: 50S ribosomal protein L31 [Candidatus Omnitrophica bacterium]|nr:50S ribosomal protein L31 [Candidatus Omnitrophota bacterium]